jgi:Family of unknown function (DUF5709)
VTSRIGEPSDPFEDEGLATPDPGLAGKRITGDPQDDFPVPGDEPVAVDDFGTTAAEQQEGESLDLRLSREEPDLLERAGALPDLSENADNPYPVDREERVGRIVETDEGARGDTEPDAVAMDVGTDQGGFTAEERAMRIEQAP